MKAAVVFAALLRALTASHALAQDAPEEKPVEKPAQDEARKQAEFDAKIGKLIKQLGSDKYKEREAASQELKKVGKPALPALKEALKSKDLEVRLRVESIMKELGTKEVSRKGRRPSTPDPTGAPSTSPRLSKEMEEALRGMPEEIRKALEEMLEKMEELEKGLEPLPKLPPFPDEDKFGKDVEKRMEEMRKRFEERLKPIEKLFPGALPKPPRTEPREEKKEEKEQTPKPVPEGKGRITVVVKRLTWKDGKLVEDKEYKYDSALPGLAVTDSGHVLEALRYHLELDKKEGVLVDEVEKDSPFAAAGLAKHDIIIKADGQTIGSRETLARLLEDKEKATLEIVRRGKRKTIELNLTGDTIPNRVPPKTPEKEK
jgi:hypothetical protein